MFLVVLFIDCLLLCINKVCTPSFDQPLGKFVNLSSVFRSVYLEEFVTILKCFQRFLDDFSLIMTLYERLEYINWSLLIVQDFLIFQVFIITVFPMYFDYQHVTSFYNIWILPSRADRKNKPEITCFRWKRHSLTLKEEFPLNQWRDVRYTTSISHFKNLYALALCVYRASGWTSVSLT